MMFTPAVIPWVEPSPKERAEALAVLGMLEDNIACAYCGGVASDWDHLRPLVKDKRPTGYISDFKNLVPSCGRCNQSKGALNWRTWMCSKATGSPASRGVADLDDRIKALERFEAWGNVVPVNIKDFVSPELWVAHWETLDRLERDLRQAQQHAAVLQAKIQESFLSLLHKADTQILETSG
jgi:hypothetical protein